MINPGGYRPGYMPRPVYRSYGNLGGMRGPPQNGPPRTEHDKGTHPDQPSKVPDEYNYVDSCNNQVEVEYWQLRNSWGKEWGDNGYFYMRRGFNEVGHEASGRFPHVSKKTAGPHPFVPQSKSYLEVESEEDAGEGEEQDL